MAIKIGKIFEDVLSEASKGAQIKELLAPLTIEGGSVKMWHYSGNLIEDDHVSTRGTAGLHSKNEFRAWGKSRAFFYGIEDGPSFDAGVPTKFKYICHIPLDYIYPVMINPNDYETSGGHYWQSMYEQAAADGYKAFIYNLGGKKGVPIIVSFIDIPIDEKFGPARGGGYRNLEDIEMDYPIGMFVDEDGDEWIIMQQDGYIKTLTNTYLTQEEDPQEAMTSYKRTFHVYEWKDARLSPEHESDYLKDIKKS